MSGERMQGLREAKPRTTLPCWFLKSHPTLTAGVCLGFPNTALPRFVVFKPSPHSSGARGKGRGHCGPLGWGTQSHGHKELHTGGNILSPVPHSLSGLPLAQPALLTAVAHSQEHTTVREQKYSICGTFSCHPFSCLTCIVPQN